MRHFLIVLSGLILMLGFQNCSKVGVKEIPVGDKVLAANYVQTTPDIPNNVDLPKEPETPVVDIPDVPAVDDGGDGDGDGGETPDVPVVVDNNDNNDDGDDGGGDNDTQVIPVIDVADKDDKHPDHPARPDRPVKSIPDVPAVDTVTSVDVAEAIAKCNDDSASTLVENLKLKFNHESVDVTSSNVLKVQGNHGGLVVIRAANDNSKAKDLHFNHSTVVLCNFKSIGKIHAVHSKLIVVGGAIQQLKSTHSHVSLVGATAAQAKHKTAVIIGYSLK